MKYPVYYKSIVIDDVTLFYREAGDTSKPGKIELIFVNNFTIKNS